MEDIILVTCCDLMRFWTNIAFSGGEGLMHRCCLEQRSSDSVNFQYFNSHLSTLRLAGQCYAMGLECVYKTVKDNQGVRKSFDVIL